MIVYRVEKDGIGPYKGCVIEKVAPEHHRMENVEIWPGPKRDGIDIELHDNPHFYCGFLDKKKLNEWFSSSVQAKLRELGYYIAKYEVDEKDVKIGRKQLVFNRDAAKLRRVLLLKKNKKVK